MYREYLKHSLSNLHDPDRMLTTQRLDMATNDLTTAIIDAYERACPLTIPKSPNRKSVWSNDLESLKRNANKA